MEEIQGGWKWKEKESTEEDKREKVEGKFKNRKNGKEKIQTKKKESGFKKKKVKAKKKEREALLYGFPFSRSFGLIFGGTWHFV